MSIEEINSLPAEAFVERLGFLFEHSPWIVRAAAARRPFTDIAAMEAAMAEVIQEAGEEAQIALLRAHPELAGKAAIAGDLTDASLSEQASAGLDRLTPEEYATFHTLNDAYRSRFGFPFIVCVRLTDKTGILTAMRERTQLPLADELVTARGEIAKIVHLRLKDAVA